jgi:hypothetical protein
MLLQVGPGRFLPPRVFTPDFFGSAQHSREVGTALLLDEARSTSQCRRRRRLMLNVYARHGMYEIYCSGTEEIEPCATWPLERATGHAA